MENCFWGGFTKGASAFIKDFYFLEEFLCGEAFMTSKTKEGGDFWDGRDFLKPFQV